MKTMSKKLSLCLAAVAVTMIFVGCQNPSGSDSAATPYSVDDINTSVPFQGTPATVQQAAQLGRMCTGRPSTQSTNTKLRKVSKSHEKVKLVGVVSPRSSYGSCMISTKENVQKAYYVGTFSLPNGRQVSALREITTTTGNIICGRRYAGHGHQTSDKVYSVRTMNGQWVGCRQNQISSTYVYRLDNGAVVDSSNGH